jgi:hypothetical protein
MQFILAKCIEDVLVAAIPDLAGHLRE